MSTTLPPRYPTSPISALARRHPWEPLSAAASRVPRRQPGTCTCAACGRSPRLDLPFSPGGAGVVVSHGHSRFCNAATDLVPELNVVIHVEGQHAARVFAKPPSYARQREAVHRMVCHDARTRTRVRCSVPTGRDGAGNGRGLAYRRSERRSRRPCSQRSSPAVRKHHFTLYGNAIL